MRVLVVDDDAVSLKLVASVLSKNDYDVVTASSGEKALAMLEKVRVVDIVVTDIMMPVMTGFHLLAYLKADTKYSQIPVILCSALSDVESVKKGITLGAADFLTKPVDADILLAKIRKVEKKLPGAVLVVDDEELLRNLLTRILERRGVRVLTACNGLEALEVLEANKISVVVTDIVMPLMDGLTLLVKAKEMWPDLPVLLISGQSGKYDPQKVLSLGADGFIAKPFKNSEILQRITPLIR